MAEPHAPLVPDTAPPELRDFLACRRASVTIRSGPLDWLPLPPELSELPKPDLTLEPGTAPGTATINIGFGMFGIGLPASVSDGQLHVDASGLPDMLGDLKQPLDDWIRNLNDWVRSQGKRFAAPTVRPGEVTLVKEPIPAAPPPAVAPVPPVAPVPVTPQAPGQASSQPGGCLKWLGLGLLLALGIGGAYILAQQMGADQPPAPGATPVAVATTPAGPSTTGTPPPATATPTATSRPTGSPPTATATTAPPGFAFNEEYVGTFFNELTGHQLPNGIALLQDPTGDQFNFAPGFPAPAQPQPWADLLGAGGFVMDLDRAGAAEFSTLFPCPSDSQPTFFVFCNQGQPFTAGPHVFILTTWAQPPPDPFPLESICSWAVQSNHDTDLGTGFPDPIPGHPLMGAETYHEALIFGTGGEYQRYLLYTDYRQPERPDTGTQQGNVPTNARAIKRIGEEAGPLGNVLFMAPAGEFGDNFSVHGYCATDRAQLLDTVAVDAIGSPADPGYPFYTNLMPSN